MSKIVKNAILNIYIFIYEFLLDYKLVHTPSLTFFDPSFFRVCPARKKRKMIIGQQTVMNCVVRNARLKACASEKKWLNVF